MPVPTCAWNVTIHITRPSANVVPASLDIDKPRPSAAAKNGSIAIETFQGSVTASRPSPISRSDAATMTTHRSVVRWWRTMTAITASDTPLTSAAESASARASEPNRRNGTDSA